ncbi:MAG: universal stress protein [bacterium]|nr:universal stress protein [bacterium]
MLKSIFVAYDRSEPARAALRYACYLASLFEGKIHVGFVIELPVNSEVGPGLMAGIEDIAVAPPTFSSEEIERIRRERESEAAELFKEAADECRQYGVAHETRLLVGYPHDEILAQARWVDVLAIGKHGLQGDGHKVGRLAQNVIRHAPQPVLVATRYADPPSEIVVLFDGSEKALHALAVGTELALASELPLTAVTGGETLDEAREVNALGLAYLTDHGVAGQAMLVTAGPAPGGASVDEELVRTLKDRMRALVVMGAFGTARVKEWIKGSTTRTILKGLECPVLLIGR